MYSLPITAALLLGYGVDEMADATESAHAYSNIQLDMESMRMRTVAGWAENDFPPLDAVLKSLDARGIVGDFTRPTFGGGHS